MASKHPTDTALHARAMAHARWSQVDDPAAATAPGRAAFLNKFEREVDPDGTLPPAERARRAEHARKRYFTELSRKSAAARRARSGGDTDAGA